MVRGGVSSGLRDRFASPQRAAALEGTFGSEGFKDALPLRGKSFAPRAASPQRAAALEGTYGSEGFKDCIRGTIRRSPPRVRGEGRTIAERGTSSAGLFRTLPAFQGSALRSSGAPADATYDVFGRTAERAQRRARRAAGSLADDTMDADEAWALARSASQPELKRWEPRWEPALLCPTPEDFAASLAGPGQAREHNPRHACAPADALSFSDPPELAAPRAPRQAVDTQPGARAAGTLRKSVTLMPAQREVRMPARRSYEEQVRTTRGTFSARELAKGFDPLLSCSTRSGSLRGSSSVASLHSCASSLLSGHYPFQPAARSL